MKTCQLTFLSMLTALVGACYGVPMESNLQIEVVPRESAPRADGAGLADVRITPSDADAVFRRLISIEASSGRFLAAGAPAEGPATLTRLAPAEGPIELVLRYSRAPGPLVVEARREEAFARAVVELAPRGPDRLEIDATPRRLLADGRDQTRVAIELSAEADARVSLGVAVHLEVCCGAAEQLESCSGEAPLHFPPTLILEEATSRIETDVVAGFVARTSTVVEELRVWLRATDRALDVPCEPEMDVVSAAVALTLTPVDG